MYSFWKVVTIISIIFLMENELCNLCDWTFSVGDIKIYFLLSVLTKRNGTERNETEWNYNFDGELRNRFRSVGCTHGLIVHENGGVQNNLLITTIQSEACFQVEYIRSSNNRVIELWFLPQHLVRFHSHARNTLENRPRRVSSARLCNA